MEYVSTKYTIQQIDLLILMFLFILKSYVVSEL